MELKLKSFFQEQIHCVTVHIDNQIKAGVVLFEYDDIVHFQYSAGTDSRNDDGALDYLFDTICKDYLDKKYISFGSCTNGDNGRKINKGLLYWKESFGAQNIPQTFYKIDVSKRSNLDSIFKL